MIKIQLRACIAAKEVRENRRISVAEVARESGVNRFTLAKMQSEDGYNATLESINALCAYLDCEVADLLVYQPDKSDNSGEKEGAEE